MSSGIQQLKSLVSILAASVATLESVYNAEKAPFPSLDSCDVSDGNFMSLPDGLFASQSIISACAMLSSLVSSKKQIECQSMAVHINSYLDLVVRTHTPEIISELGGTRGVHVEAISTANKIEAGRLARILRSLAAHHWFKEVSPNIFANNRNSSLLGTDKTPSQLSRLGSWEAKFDESGRSAAVVLLGASEGLRSSPALYKTLTAPRFSGEVPFQRAYGTDLEFWTWLGLPENDLTRKRFALAFASMNTTHSMSGGLDWKALPDRTLIVDVGGGVGTATRGINSQNPRLRHVVQDRPETIALAKQMWSQTHAADVKSGRIRLEAHDFFTPQPIKGADIYFMRTCLHNWADIEATNILRNLRDATTSQSKLVLHEFLLEYVCEDPDTAAYRIPGVRRAQPAPKPLLPNFGAGNALPFQVDMQMMVLSGSSRERTADDWHALLCGAGWDLISVHRGMLTAEFICVPRST